MAARNEQPLASTSREASKPKEQKLLSHMYWLRNAAKKLKVNLQQWTEYVLDRMDINDKRTFIETFKSSEGKKDIVTEFASAAKFVSKSQECPEDLRQQLCLHIQQHGGANYKVPTGILKRLKVIAQYLEEDITETMQIKMDQWNVKLLRNFKSAFGAHSEIIRDLRKVRMETDEATIYIQCPECPQKIVAHRPGTFHARFELIMNHLRSHFPNAVEDSTKKTSKKRKKDSSKLNNTAKRPNNESSSVNLDQSQDNITDENHMPGQDDEMSSLSSLTSFDSDNNDWVHLSSLPPMLRILTENSLTNSWGHRGNRFSDNMLNLSAYIYVRAQKSAFEFLSSNLNGPSIWSVKAFIDKHSPPHREGELLFDRLLKWLQENNFPLEVMISEDGTKIVPKVEYCSTTNTLTGLVGPNTDTGFPSYDNFKATTAEEISNLIIKYPAASYIQCILAVPNIPHAPAFLLGFYGTDNKFTTCDVMTRNEYIRNELEKRGIKVLTTSSDGDSRHLSALKVEMNFGTVYRKGKLNLLANPNAKNIGNIDGYHKAKGLVDRLFNLGIMMKLGNYIPSVNHLLMVYKFNHKVDHDLTLKDLDVTNHLNYARIDKILDQKVFNALKEIPQANGTLAYLQLVDAVMNAYVRPNVHSKKRLESAVFCVELIRQWKQHLLKNNLKSPNFTITDNVFESLELNLAFLYSMIEQGNDQNINELNSQANERWYRKLRSFTGVECTVTNVTMKTFIERVKYIEFEEIALLNLKVAGIIVNKMQKRQDLIQNQVYERLTQTDIDDAVEKGKSSARLLCESLGISFNKFEVSKFCRKLNLEAVKQKEEKLNRKRLHESSQEQDQRSAASEENSSNTFHVAGLEFSSEPSQTYELQLADGKLFRKDRLVHILFNDTTYVSTDLRERFKPRGILTITPRAPILNALWINETIGKGDYAVFEKEKKYYVGLIFNFMNNNRSTIKSATVYKDILMIDQKCDINLILNPLYEFSPSGLMLIDSFEKHFLCREYCCHAKDLEIFQHPNLYDLIRTF